MTVLLVDRLEVIAGSLIVSNHGSFMGFRRSQFNSYIEYSEWPTQDYNINCTIDKWQIDTDGVIVRWCYTLIVKVAPTKIKWSTQVRLISAKWKCMHTLGGDEPDSLADWDKAAASPTTVDIDTRGRRRRGRWMGVVSKLHVLLLVLQYGMSISTCS